MSWIILIIAGLLEVVGVNGIQRYIKGQKVSGILFVVFGFAISLTLLAIAMDISSWCCICGVDGHGDCRKCGHRYDFLQRFQRCKAYCMSSCHRCSCHWFACGI